MLPEVNEQFVLTKCNFLAKHQFWPRKARMDPEGWLGNFRPDDRRMASQLLNSFLYYSEELVDRMFASAVQGLSRDVTSSTESLKDRRLEWARFIDQTVFTFPTGEIPFAGDSGHLYVRRLRDVVGLDEEQIQSPELALRALKTGSKRNVVFVDDFVGTGQQFLKTWQRPYDKTGSFADMWLSKKFSAYYSPIFCTRYAMDGQLDEIADQVSILPAHWLDARHSLLTQESVWWPASMKTEASDFIFRYSMSIGVPDTGGYDERDWQGYNCLGLTIGFCDCVPDATIPLFDTRLGGWRPLWKRVA